MEVTTIKLYKKTKKRLNKLKVSKRESYEDVLKRILDILNICRINPAKARDKLIVIDKMQRDF